MLVNQWMTRDVLAIAPGDTLAVAVERMVRYHVRRLLVQDHHGRLLGVLARSDVLRAAPAGVDPFTPLGIPAANLQTPVSDAMAKAVISVPSDLAIEDAARLMNDCKIGVLPVLSGDLTVGVVTRSDLFRAFIALLGEDQSGLRLSFDVTQTEDAVAFAVQLAQRHGMRLASVSTFMQDGRKAAVVRLVGYEPPGMLDEVWKTGHRVLSVIRHAGPKPQVAP
ncbi:MAG TPA: CBS domain-containing protein [Polyangia bacterium]|jgi:acetoin utilization protein AcuB|nr:CBS domain-containing protein [Polyangia bacterium]